MANDFYDQGLEGIMDASIVLLTANLKLALVKSGYTCDLAADKFMSAISSGDIIARSANLASKVVSLRTFSSAATTFTAAPAGVATQVVLYKDAGGADSANRLIASWTGGTGLPFTTNGSDVALAFSGAELTIARA